MSAGRQSTRRRRRVLEGAGQSSAISETSISTTQHVSGEAPEVIEESTEHETVPIESSTPAYVRVSGGRTISTAQYESLRIDIAIEMPCEPTKGEVVKKYREVTETLDQLMRNRIPSEFQ